MRISNFSSMCHFFLISRGRARQLHLIVRISEVSFANRKKLHLSIRFYDLDQVPLNDNKNDNYNNRLP